MKLPVAQGPYKHTLEHIEGVLEVPGKTDRTGHIASGLMTWSYTKSHLESKILISKRLDFQVNFELTLIHRPWERRIVSITSPCVSFTFHSGKTHIHMVIIEAAIIIINATSCTKPLAILLWICSQFSLFRSFFFRYSQIITRVFTLSNLWL